MKLIITQTNLTLRGGAEKIILKIAKHYDAKIYTAEYDKAKTFEEFKDTDIETIRIPRITGLLPYGRVAQGLNYGLSFNGFRVRDDYDVINAHLAPSHWIRNRNARVLWYVHTPLRDIYDLYEYRLSLKKLHQKPIYIIGAKVVRAMDQNVVKRIEGLLANSNNTKSRIVRYYGRKDAKVLNGGIDYKLYSNNGDEKYFIYLSRFSPNKRQEYAIRAFEIFRRKLKGYKLILAGAVSKDRFYHDYYLKIVEMARKAGDVKIIADPEEDRLRSLYSKCTAVLYTPINEDYGIVPLDAMASYKPIISVNEGGPRETIVNGKTGFLVNSVEEMAAKMRFVVDNPALTGRMGRAGRERVEKHYSWARFFKEFDKALRRVSSH